jgi:hypothetical protein
MPQDSAKDAFDQAVEQHHHEAEAEKTSAGLSLADGRKALEDMQLGLTKESGA